MKVRLWRAVDVTTCASQVKLLFHGHPILEATVRSEKFVDIV